MSDSNNLALGANGESGSVTISNSSGKVTISLQGDIDDRDAHGSIVQVADGDGTVRLELGGDIGAISAFSKAVRGAVGYWFGESLGIGQGALGANESTLLDGTDPGRSILAVGGPRNPGSLVVNSSLTDNSGFPRPTVSIDGGYGTVVATSLSGHDVNATNAASDATVELDGSAGSIACLDANRHVSIALHATTDNAPATIYVANATGQNQIHIDGGGVIGADNAQGDRTINLDGNTGTLTVAGDIVLSGADLAEDFEVADGAGTISPGSVVVATEDGTVRLCETAEDTHVLGVVAGAGCFRPGVILNRPPGADLGRRAPVALLGRAYCRVDAGYGPVRIGDLLTTSRTPGHAMRAPTPAHAGTVIGKALAPLTDGCALIPTLIAMR